MTSQKNILKDFLRAATFWKKKFAAMLVLFHFSLSICIKVDN
jgi:hypothetical protein